MKNNLRFISIDGTRGIGKTTQVRRLAGALRDIGLNVKILHIKDTLPSINRVLDDAVNFLEQDGKNMIVCDGSIARMIVSDDQSKMHQSQIFEKYRDVIFKYENMNHKYGMVNILLISDDIDLCNTHILKQVKLTKVQKEPVNDKFKETEIVDRMRIFDSHVVSKTVKYHPLEITREDSILDVESDIWDFLESISTLKKPSKE